MYGDTMGDGLARGFGRREARGRACGGEGERERVGAQGQLDLWRAKVLSGNTLVEPKAGRHFTCATPNRSAHAFAGMIAILAAAYPRARTIHLVLDNLNIHVEKSVTDRFGRRRGHALWRRLTVHYTPKHGSWLNQAEIELSLVARQCLGRRRIPTLAQLRTEIRAWNRRANRLMTNIHWAFTRKDARRKFGYRKPYTRSKT